MQETIRLENVSTTYEGEKRPAIKNLNLFIMQNDFVYVVGPNASGKTTLLETIIGLLKTSQGQVYVLSHNIKKNGRETRCKIGYVPQDFIVDPSEPFTALDVIMMGMYGKIGLLGRVRKEHRQKALEIMEELGIEDLANRPVGKLSGGQQQKVMIARALAKEPEILLLDEPSSNLDIESRQRIPKMISQLHTEKGLTTIIVTHDVSQVSENKSRVVVMNEGRIIAEKTVAEFLSSMKEFWWLPALRYSK